VDFKGENFQVYGADGMTEVLTFPFSPDRNAITPLVQRLTQFRNAIHLLALENPNPGLRLSIRVAQSGGRAIALNKDTMEAPKYRVRRSADPRSAFNSLQLEIGTDTDAYITVIDVDAEGNVNLLFPNSYQRPDFYPAGFVKAGKMILLPDSLQTGNRAGFHWDIAAPTGIDTIRVFGTTNRRLAERIRRAVQTSGHADAEMAIILGRPLTLLQINNLKRELFGSITNGTTAVPDQLPDWSAASATITVEQ
jgi:hypothetical protein